MDFRAWADALCGWGKARRRNVVLLSSADSTNRVGLAVAAQVEGPDVEGLDVEAWIFALHQRAGRGRFGRAWSSPPGAGVYASWVFKAPRVALETLPLLVGAGLCEGLASLGIDCRLKWPNDLLLGGAKLGGILLQTRGAKDPATVVAGFGVNHSHEAGDLPGPEATSLASAAPDRLPTLSRLATVLAEAVETEVEVQRGLAVLGSGARDRALLPLDGSPARGDAAIPPRGRDPPGGVCGFLARGSSRAAHGGRRAPVRGRRDPRRRGRGGGARTPRHPARR